MMLEEPCPNCGEPLALLVKADVCDNEECGYFQSYA
jgi:hypothetical protein